MGYPQLYRGYFGRGVRERGQAAGALTGVVAAGLASGGVVWTLRYPETTPMPGNSAYIGKRLYVQALELQYTTITAFTTPTTAGRHLELVRGAPTSATASNPSGGAAFTMVRKRSDVTDENLGVGRVATTAALTMTGFTLETPSIHQLPLSGRGAAGAEVQRLWRFDGVQADPIYLLPGELIAIRAGADFDAGGTFELNVNVDAVELVGV